MNAHHRLIFVRLVSVITLALSAPPVLAEDFKASGRIITVTVFADRARVTRDIELTLPAGGHTLIVGDLPATTAADSLRVSVDDGVTLGQVTTRRVYDVEFVREQEQRLNAQLTRLRDQRRALDDQIKSLQVQVKFIEGLSAEAPKSINPDIARGKPDPETWRAAWTVIGQGAAAAYQRIQEKEIERRETDREIEQTARELQQIQTGQKETVEARIELNAKRAGATRVRLIYETGGAQWRPYYEARLDSAQQRLALAQYGEITQRTGEEWKNVALTLSTAQPGGSNYVPALEPWYIDILPPPRIFRSAAPASPMKAAEAERRAMLKDEVAQEEMDAISAEAPVPLATVAATEFTAEYQLTGKTTVAADGLPARLEIVTHTLPVNVKARTAPKLETRAYIIARARYEGPEFLLPGDTALLHDGAYAGRTELPLVRPGEEFPLAFGPDEKLKVRYLPRKIERAEKGVFSSQTQETRRYAIELTNFHGAPLEIEVLDQLPVPRDTRIEVAPVKDISPGAESDFEGAKGVRAWRVTLAPQQTQTLISGYTVRHPADEKLGGFE